MKTRFSILGLVLILSLITSCAPTSLSGLGSSDPDAVATAAAATLAATSKSSTFGATPDTIYYGPGCKSDQPTSLILYYYKPETWVTSPGTGGGTILGVDFDSTYAFTTDPSGYILSPEPDVLTYSTAETPDGYRFAVLDLSTKSFTGTPGWLYIDLNMVVLRISGDLGSIGSTWAETTSVSQIYLVAKPCPKVPIDLLYTSRLPTSDSRFSGKITVTPDLVYNKPPCTPAVLSVQFKPDAGPGLATSEPIEYWAVFNFTPGSSSVPHGGIMYQMFWAGGSDGLWQVDVPLSDWTAITESGTIKTRVEVLPAGDTSGVPLYTAYAPGEVKLEICPGGMTIACPADITAYENSSTGATVEFPAPEFSDGCGGYSATCTPPSGSSFPLGVTTVGCTATDSCGNHDLCSFKVTVNPARPVGITCPDNVSVTTDSDSGAVVTYSASPEGGCSNPTYYCIPPSGSTFPLGTTAVTCIASDTCRQTKSCTFLVAVTKPTGFSCSQLSLEQCNSQQYPCHWVQDPNNPPAGSCQSNN